MTKKQQGYVCKFCKTNYDNYQFKVHCESQGETPEILPRGTAFVFEDTTHHRFYEFLIKFDRVHPVGHLNFYYTKEITIHDKNLEPNLEFAIARYSIYRGVSLDGQSILGRKSRRLTEEETKEFFQKYSRAIEIARVFERDEE